MPASDVAVTVTFDSGDSTPGYSVIGYPGTGYLPPFTSGGNPFTGYPSTGIIVPVNPAPGTGDTTWVPGTGTGVIWAPVTGTVIEDELIKCSITFDANGGKGTMAPIEATLGKLVTLPECAFTPPAGKQFVGWKKLRVKEGTVGENIINTHLNADGNMILFAQWEDIPDDNLTPSDGGVWVYILGSEASGKHVDGWAGVKEELEDVRRKLNSGEAEPGVTATIDMDGETKVPGGVLDAIAGQDVNVTFDLGGGVTWTVNGRDVSVGAGDLDLGVSTGGVPIPVDVVGGVAAGKDTAQLELDHDGPFGATLQLSVNVGTERDGLWANLYWFNEGLRRLVFQSGSQVADGSASWPFDHASSYLVVFDTVNHANPFTDVTAADWFGEPVLELYLRGLMNGVTPTTFVPSGATTRAMLATILWRMAGEPVVNAAIPFADVAEGLWYSEAVRWAAAEGIVQGADGKFAPTAPITREALVTMLHRYAVSAGMDVSIGENTNILSYNDAFDIAEYAIAPFQWACGAGIVEGEDGYLDPKAQARRSEVAAMVVRMGE